MRVKDDMITQKIKRWLGKLFAWWPWGHSPETSYVQAISNMNPGVTQESMLRNSVDGPVPQTGNTSVAIEHGSGEDISEPSRPTSEERLNLPLPLANKQNQTLEEAPPPSPTPEQKLAFLQYLVKRGILNEGFGEGQLPRQYQKSQK
jgi:hypothetical protein